MPEGPPWEEDEGECFAPYHLYECVRASAFQARDAFVIFDSAEAVIRGRNRKFLIFEILEKYDFSMLENCFGIIWNSSGLILVLPGSSFHVFIKNDAKMAPQSVSGQRIPSSWRKIVDRIDFLILKPFIL